METEESENKMRVCPVALAGGLDNSVRRLLQNPAKILKPFIKNGMTVLDLGCGPGFFSVEIAKMLAGSGKVIAADLQEGMLRKVMEKIRGTELEQRIELHQCEISGIGVAEKVDFILIFYVVHEIPDQEKLFGELRSVLKPGGRILIIEPKLHVSKRSFAAMTGKIKNMGFKITEGPKVFFSRSVLLDIVTSKISN